MREFATGTLMGRPAAPAELAPFLVYLASPESDYMTGQMYMVDGGQVLVCRHALAPATNDDITEEP